MFRSPIAAIPLLDQRLLEDLRHFLSIRLFDFGGSTIHVSTALSFALGVAVAVLLASLGRRATERFLGRRLKDDEGTVKATGRLVSYFVMGLGVLVSIHAVGVDMSALFAAGAVFAVAIGFAMQNILQNFVSGLILLSERTIKQGDVIEVNGVFVRIKEMGVRVTVARSPEDEDLIIPNSLLAGSIVKNFTFRDKLYRIRVVVGVAYDSDLDLVRSVLERAADELPGRSASRDPVVLLHEFGSSSIDYEMSVWIEDPWHAKPISSDLREGIWRALKASDITIAFPQLDVHFDQSVAPATPDQMAPATLV